MSQCWKWKLILKGHGICSGQNTKMTPDHPFCTHIFIIPSPWIWTGLWMWWILFPWLSYIKWQRWRDFSDVLSNQLILSESKGTQARVSHKGLRFKVKRFSSCLWRSQLLCCERPTVWLGPETAPLGAESEWPLAAASKKTGISTLHSKGSESCYHLSEFGRRLQAPIKTTAPPETLRPGE